MAASTFPNSLRGRKLETIYKALDQTIIFLTPALPFLNSHNVEFFVKSNWNNYLPQKLRQDLEQLPVSPSLLKSHIDNLCSDKWKIVNDLENKNIHFNNCTLQELVEKLRALGLEELKMSTPVEKVPFLNLREEEGDNNVMLKLDINEKDLQFDTFMSPKKMHEVETMGYFVNQITKVATNQNYHPNHEKAIDYVPSPNVHKIQRIVDFGSGKGYLSSFLALLYKLKVVAIDASPGNTVASMKRTERLRKTWIHLLRRAIQRAKTGTCDSRGRRWKAKRHIDVREVIVNNSYSSTEVQDSNEMEELCKGLTNLNLVVNRNVDLNLLLRSVNDERPELELGSEFGIVGLHTCGPLGVDSIYAFLNHTDATFLCNVPCCYHHLEEMTFPSSQPDTYLALKNKKPNFWADQDAATNPEPSFPLSEYLKRKEFNLGRNARMLSSYTFQRKSMELEKDLDVDQHLIWRLVLQVIIHEKQGHSLMEYTVGSIGKKCLNFEQYVQMSLEKLHLSEIEVTPDEINEVYQRYEPQFERFHCYYLIRTMFAPLIENCILLDRLAFLLEQKLVKDAFIVKLFDQCKSPRANAIVAFRSQDPWDGESTATF